MFTYAERKGNSLQASISSHQYIVKQLTQMQSTDHIIGTQKDKNLLICEVKIANEQIFCG